MKKSTIKQYRQTIQKLSIENEELKALLKKYDENGFSKIVDDTLKMKEKYEVLMKEAIEYRDEYECLVKKQKQIIDDYKYGINRI